MTDDYRKPAGAAPEEPLYPPSPDEVFIAAVRAHDVSLFSHAGRIFDVRFLRQLDRKAALGETYETVVFEVVEYAPAPWWRFWDRAQRKLSSELVRGAKVLSSWRWKNASASTPLRRRRCSTPLCSGGSG